MSTLSREKICYAQGRRLQEERESLGYKSQESLGIKVEKSKRTITNWESGVSSPDAADLQILDGLGFDVLYIISGMRSALLTKEVRAAYITPARMVAAELSSMQISDEDADALLLVARRFDRRK